MKKGNSNGLKIFLDFDDAMFNTKAFKEKFIGVFQKHGVSKEDFDKSYKDYPTVVKRNISKYDPRMQIRVLEKRLGIEGKRLKRDINKFLSGTDKFITSDVLPFLKKFKKKNLFLITYGDAYFQKIKIRNCGIRKYFSKVVVTDKLKAEEITKLADNVEKETFVFIDDRADQIESVKKKFPYCATFLIKRKEGRYNDKRTKHVDFEVKNLTEAGKIIGDIAK